MSVININEKVAKTDFSNFTCRKTGFLDFTGFFMSKKHRIKTRNIQIRYKSKPQAILIRSVAELRLMAENLNDYIKLSNNSKKEKMKDSNIESIKLMDKEQEISNRKLQKKSILRKGINQDSTKHHSPKTASKLKVSFNKNRSFDEEGLSEDAKIMPSPTPIHAINLKRSYSTKSNFNTEGDQIAFYSDREENKIRVEKLNKLEKHARIVEFLTDSIPMSKRIIKIKANRKKHNLTQKDEDDKIQMIDRYNKYRAAKGKQNGKQDETYKEEAGLLIANWFNTLNILQPKVSSIKKSNVDFKDGAFYDKATKLSPDESNKLLVQNIYFQSEHQTEKFYPDLMSLNPLRFIQNDSFKILKPRLLYDLFCQYKVIMKLCLALNNSVKCLKQGLDFPAFHQLLPEVATEEKSFAHCIFNIFNKCKSGYVTLEEFISGISRLRSSKTEDKIDIFMRILDSDGNGKLSYEEVHDLSISSLNRVLGEGNPDMKESLAELFAEMIFKICNAERDSEIELPAIRNKILLGGLEADYLEMFCCASR